LTKPFSFTEDLIEDGFIDVVGEWKGDARAVLERWIGFDDKDINGLASPRALVELGVFLDAGQGCWLLDTDNVNEFCNFGRVFSEKTSGFEAEVDDCSSFFIVYIGRFEL
jgi:hypothetical protein